MAAAEKAAKDWENVPIDHRASCLKRAQEALVSARDSLAHGISLEVGKPITEALGEVAAVIAKIELTIADAERFLAPETPPGTAHPSIIRRRPLGPAAVIAPYNFPLHLGHGAAMAHLMAGNPVLFKPSPLAAAIAAQYSALVAPCFPDGVFQLVQGGATTARSLCLDERVRAVTFTGSVSAGRSIARDLAGNFQKELALELGGLNALLVCADADLDLAAAAAADGVCLTTGQRCNSTSRILVHRDVADAFIPKFLETLKSFAPGDPLQKKTTLGPLIHAGAVERYRRFSTDPSVKWLIPGAVHSEVNGKQGHYVSPAVGIEVCDSAGTLDEEPFAPIVRIKIIENEAEMIHHHNASSFGLTASIFTASGMTFERIGNQLNAGNIYANLATTFSPSTLPFGGWENSGNGRPGGRNFIRFATREQVVQSTRLN